MTHLTSAPLTQLTTLTTTTTHEESSSSSQSKHFTSFEKMISGHYYYGFDPELLALRKRANQLCQVYNRTANEVSNQDRIAMLRNLFQDGVAHLKDEEMPWIEPPFFCDYGTNIRFGKHVYLNFNCIILDCARVSIGDNVLFGPSCRLYTAQHPLSPHLRQGIQGPEYAGPIHIASDCWFGGDVIVLSHVSIASGCTFGAGSVLTQSFLQPNSIGVGNPCKLKSIVTKDMEVKERNDFDMGEAPLKTKKMIEEEQAVANKKQQVE